jgi:hypothetical protein
LNRIFLLENSLRSAQSASRVQEKNKLQHNFMTKYDILIWDREWDGLNGSLLRKLEFIYLCSKINQSKTELFILLVSYYYYL